jgi:DNA-binding MarR family transcriptional regulator
VPEVTLPVQPTLPTQPTPDQFRAVAALRSALRHFSRDSERIAREEGLTPRQYLLLLQIKGAADGSERSTVTELARRLQLTQSTVTELVRRAEDAGLLSREGSREDARVTWLSLSPEGERRLLSVFARLGPERKRLYSILAEAGGLDEEPQPSHSGRSKPPYS